MQIKPAFKPEFNWAPHLTPTVNNIIDQHVFRSPALIATDQQRGIVIIPDLDIPSRSGKNRWYMDMDAENNILSLGMSASKVSDHVLYERQPGAVYEGGIVEYGFYIIKYTEKQELANPFRLPLQFMWNKWGHDRLVKLSSEDFEPYVKYTYNWAFNTWEKKCLAGIYTEWKESGCTCIYCKYDPEPQLSG